MDDKNRDDIKKRLEELRKQNNRKDNNNKSPFGGSHIFFSIIILIVLSILFFWNGSIPNYFQQKKEVPYSEFITKVKNGTFKEVTEKDDKMLSEVKENKKSTIYITRKITERIGQDPNIIQAVENKKIALNVAEPSTSGLVLAFIVNVFPLILMIGISIYFIRRIMGNSQGGGPGNIFGFGKSRADRLDKKPDVKFDDVAGVDGAKEELREVVDFLKNPEKYTKAGARVPKGVLLLGRPGTGKTLLAKAVAGESGASFYTISGSEFVEMFVGVGASRVRDLFEKAKSSTPSIIFIDEIDAIGRRRSTGKNSGSNDEREQTLNQLLVEMDGFETDTKVIVIAATNREDILDPALLRAGRFDRRIQVDAPDLQGRIAILKVHAKNKKLAADVKLEDIAKITPGFVGADLANLLNEAAILAARKSSDTIVMEDLDEAVDKIGMGLGQKSKIIKPEEKKLLAYHEGGHAIMSELTPGADPVHKVTIIPRGDAGGFMMPLPEERLVMGSKQILAKIKVAFGGRAAEELVLDDISTGAYSDIKHATMLARRYVESVGMSKKLGPVNLENSDDEFSFVSNKSNETAREIDLEIRKILSEEYENTLNTLRENRDKLDRVAGLLLKKETITGDEVRKIIAGATIEEVLNGEKNTEEKEEQNSENNDNVQVDHENKQQENNQAEKKTDENSEDVLLENNAEETYLQSTEVAENIIENDNLEEIVKSEEVSDINEANQKDDEDENDSHFGDNDEVFTEEKEEKKIEIPNFMK
ncbi:MAG: ATP-dependent metallopeptidase FtsH/Yme1/Tma family protein [Pseudoleptotrichia goodfellowii]|nr:ATP-dependent metallopeptidase FtsH/Yme1/Tma family protein [Pseudoleptotrichia goodfellowii]